MTSFEFESLSEDCTIRLGRTLGDVLPLGTVVALTGTLGAGKTRLVRAIAAACGIDPLQVTSPTFVLVQEYHGHKSIYHVDAYRLRDEDEFESLGIVERFDEDCLVIVEWADRVRRSLPRELIEIEIAVTGQNSRLFRISCRGGRLAETVKALGAGEWQSDAAGPS